MPVEDPGTRVSGFNVNYRDRFFQLAASLKRHPLKPLSPKGLDSFEVRERDP